LRQTSPSLWRSSTAVPSLAPIRASVATSPWARLKQPAVMVRSAIRTRRGQAGLGLRAPAAALTRTQPQPCWPDERASFAGVGHGRGRPTLQRYCERKEKPLILLEENSMWALAKALATGLPIA